MRAQLGMAVLVAVSVLAMGSGNQPNQKKPVLSAQDLELAVQRELEVGSDRARVAAFLKARGITFSDTFEPENIIRAELEHSTAYYTIKGSPIVAQFWFNREGKLIKHNIREAIAGL